MNGITSRCVSFTQGNTDPLQRVNYEFGLVLGVDEFVDEQRYFLEKEYQHNRSLHGYGTVSGLLVSAGENGDDIEVQVDSGIGIDQYGRVIVVRTPQCASLLSWLEEQDLEAGDQSIYVIARYAECETALVPIAGQPCSSSDQLTAASRLQDVFEIELALEPPQHPARDAAVNLAEFLSRFRADAEAEDVSGVGEASRLVTIIGPEVIAQAPVAFVGHIDDVVEEITGTAGATIIPVQPQIVESLLNDIFTYWVTEVRPTLSPDLIDPDVPKTADGEPPAPEILLARVDLTIPEDGQVQMEGIAVENGTRPYLLNMQLIQELFDIPEVAGESGEGRPPQDVRAFATIEDISTRLLNLWLHLGENLILQANENVNLMRVQPDGSLEMLRISLSEDDARRGDAGRFFRIQTFVNLENDDFLLLRFDSDAITVGDDGAQTLSDFIDNAPFTYQNYDRRQNRLFAFHVVERGESISEDEIRDLILELMPPPEPTIPFVTVTPITLRENILEGYELWFHLDGVAEQNEGGIESLNEENVAVYVETAPGAVDELPLEAIQQIRPNVWMIMPQPTDDQAFPPLVRVLFSLGAPMGIRAFHPENGNMEEFETLSDYMRSTGQRLEGHQTVSERLGEALVVYAREQGSARRLEQ